MHELELASGISLSALLASSWAFGFVESLDFNPDNCFALILKRLCLISSRNNKYKREHLTKCNKTKQQCDKSLS